MKVRCAAHQELSVFSLWAERCIIHYSWAPPAMHSPPHGGGGGTEPAHHHEQVTVCIIIIITEAALNWEVNWANEEEPVWLQYDNLHFTVCM